MEQQVGGKAGTRMKPTFPLLRKLPARVSEIAHCSGAGRRGIANTGRPKRGYASK